MFDPRSTNEDLATWVAELDPARLSGGDARALLDAADRAEKLCGAAVLLLAKRVAETDAWKDDGDRSAAHWLARRTGISVGEARAKIETAERLADLPKTTEAVRAGRLSDQQAREVSAGAIADPEAEDDLLDTAATESLHELRDRSRRAQAVDDAEGRRTRTHRNRGVWSGVDPDGTFRLSYRGTAESGSRILTALKPFTDHAFKQAKAEGRKEPLAAYAADGLVAMADAARTAGGAGTPGNKVPENNVKVIVSVDLAALRRGHVEHGETCEIRGVGSVPVATARAMLGDAALAIVIKDGVDVKNVTHAKRRTTAHQRTVLEWWGLKCDIKGCDSTDFVDVHHVFEWARHHRTRIDELTVRCKHHHRQHHRGWEPPPDRLRRPPPEQFAWSA